MRQWAYKAYEAVAIDPDIPLLTGRKPEMGLTTSEQEAHKYENKSCIFVKFKAKNRTSNNEGKRKR